MKMDSFDISEHTNVVIYGAGQIGRLYQKRLEKWCNVVAFFDLHPEKIRSSMSIPVYNPFVDTKNVTCDAVIVCLHSSVIHDEVALSLYRIGYKNILFIPEEDGIYNFEAKSYMRQCYCALTEEDYTFLHAIPDYELLIQFRGRANIIRKNDKFIVISLSHELIYVGGEKQPDQRALRDSPQCSIEYKTAYDTLGKYTDKPLLMFKLYRDLFNAFLYGENTANEYCKICKQIQNMGYISDEEFLKERYQVFSMFERKYKTGLSGFYDCPVEVEWNPKGYFEIVDGNHRAMYLYCKMSNLVPVRMRVEDYNFWLNQKEVDRFVKYIKNDMKRTIRTPILNPVLMDYPYHGNTYLQNNLYAVLEFLGVGQPYSKLSFIDLGCDNGYFARRFMQLGFKEVRVVEEEETFYDFDIALSRLLIGPNTDVRYSASRYDFKGQYDIAYICDEGFFEKRKEIMPQLNQKINYMLILFCQVKQGLDAYILQNSKFKWIKQLRKLLVGNQLWELLVCCKNDMGDLSLGKEQEA